MDDGEGADIIPVTVDVVMVMMVATWRMIVAMMVVIVMAMMVVIVMAVMMVIVVMIIMIMVVIVLVVFLQPAGNIGDLAVRIIEAVDEQGCGARLPGITIAHPGARVEFLEALQKG